jgi:hypothetical protein
MLSALIPGMILIFIEGIGIAAVAFMLTFFNAMVRELHHDRAPGIVERQKICPEPASSKQYQQQDRAA